MDIIMSIPREKIPEWMIQLAEDMEHHRGISKLEALRELILDAVEHAKAY